MSSWQAAYSEFLPLLIGVTRNLITRGYVMDGGESLDTIHDFFVDEWAGIQERFDPRKGELRTYVAVSFSRYARRRSTYQARWHRWYGEMDDLRATSEPPAGPDMEKVRAALERLQRPQRELLMSWFSRDEGVSEVEFARARAISRYKLRQRLAEALGAFFGMIGDTGGFSDREALVARELLARQRPIEVVASDLGMTVGQVRRVRQVLLQALGRAAQLR